MIQMSLSSLLVIVGLGLTFFSYVAVVSYRIGALTTRLNNAEKDIAEMQTGHATKSDVAYIKQTLARMDRNIGKLFDHTYKKGD